MRKAEGEEGETKGGDKGARDASAPELACHLAP